VPAVNVRELARNTSKVIGDVARRKRRRSSLAGVDPSRLVVPIDADALEKTGFSPTHRKFVHGMRKATRSVRIGQTVGMDEASRVLGQKVRRRRPGAPKRSVSAKTTRS